MIKYRDINIFSKSLVVMGLFFYFLDYIFDGVVSASISLTPLLVIENLDVWRTALYPFAVGTIEGVVLFAFTFFMIAPKLENLIGSLRFPIWLFLITLLQGFVMILTFWGTSHTLSGMEGISIFILVLFALLHPKEKINFFGGNIRAYLLAIVLGASWIGAKSIRFDMAGAEDIATSVFSAIFGTFVSVLTFFQIKVSERAYRRKKLREAAGSEYKMPEPEELSMALLSGNKFRKNYHNMQADMIDEEEGRVLSEDPDENEEKLNEILDKINSDGKNSLTRFENRFLDEYSKTLK